MGKTRLVIQAVQHPEVKRLFQRIHFVPLAALNSPELLASAIADSVHFTTMNQEGFDAQLVNYLSDKAMLLVLDNLEHLMGTGGGKLLVDILNRAPAVKLLVTSRERLDLRGEWLLALQGLPVSEAGTDSYSGQHVSSAIQLFIQCARMVQADFALDEK